MRSLFVVHATIWDVALLVIVGGFAVLYFSLWAASAWQDRKRKKQ